MSQAKHTFVSPIVGCNYYAGYTFVANIPDGAELTLDREPDNRFDPNAIGVYYADTKCGHIPRDIAAQLAPILDAGDFLGATKDSFADTRITYNLRDSYPAIGGKGEAPRE